jgi:kynurenine formamidase
VVAGNGELVNGAGGGGRPRYRDLPAVEDGSGARLAWDYFGRKDELGTLNFISPEAVLRGRDEIRTGERIGLTLPQDLPDPPLSVGRRPYEHAIEVRRNGRDDSVSSFFLQGSSQWDGLRHVRYKQFGYYGGRQEEDLNGDELGVDRMAEAGIVTRGVLVDVPAFRAAAGRTSQADTRDPVTVAEIEEICAWERVELAPGDILLLRTGWLAWYLGLDAAGRESLRASLHNSEGGLECPGLASGVGTAEWLWDHGIAAVAADNPALEVLRVDRVVGFLHRFLIPMLGMPIGEYWYLEGLHQAAAGDGRFTCCLFSQPLRIPRAAGSPSNALAVR